MKKLPFWARIVIILAVLAVISVCWEVVSSRNTRLVAFKRSLVHGLLGISNEDVRAETLGLASGYTVKELEGMRLYEHDSGVRLVNYIDGYQIDLPGRAEADTSMSGLYTTVTGSGYSVTISRETATYAGMKDVITSELATFAPFLFRSEGVKNHVEWYEYRFLLNEDWQRNNRVSVSRSQGKNGELLISAYLSDSASVQYPCWLHAVRYTDGREYIRMCFRFENRELESALSAAAQSVRVFDPVGERKVARSFGSGQYTGNDSAAAKLYESVKASDSLIWGVYATDIYETGISETVPALEKKLDYSFGAVLCYIHLDMPFPTEFMEKVYESGKIVELTLQTTYNNNTDLTAPSPLLDIYTGRADDVVRSIARDAAAWGKPFLFRLNNEMNSDWTSYSGVVNMCDPEVYAGAWRRVFEIFREEGADNCLWIWNPHDRSAPPARWNDGLAFWPGEEYVHLLGVTGYNNGTYYTQNAEKWRSFSEIYDGIQAEYSPYFSGYPWIITEFASSGIGGDKAAWIDEMFARMGDYKNIKIAVWFSSADYDGETPARTYWLDETAETVEAFRRGLHK